MEWYNDSELFNNLMEALSDYGEKVAETYKQRLERDGKRASGDLINSVKPLVAYKAQGGEFDVFLQMEDYWKYVEKGLKGRGKRRNNSESPFPAPENWKGAAWYILNWIREKGISPRPDEKGKLPTEEQLSYAIARSINDDGVKAGNQLRDTLQNVNAVYLPKLQEALEKDWEDLSYKIWADIGKMVKI